MAQKRNIKQYSKQMKDKHLKQTKQREIIVGEILVARAGEHFSAEDLWERLRRKKHKISKATVYRTLNLLIDEKVVEEHDFGRGQKYYEKLVERPHHDHLICVHCGQISEFENEEIEQIQQKVAKKGNFHLYYHSHKLFGACSKCYKRMKR